MGAGKAPLSLVGAALVLALVASDAVVTAPRVDARPRRPTVLVIEGRGYGHGRGMGQYGARGMAEHGAGWRRIVRHYYRGAHIDRRDVARLRVLVASSRTAVFHGALEVSRRGDALARAPWIRVRRPARSLLIARASSPNGPWHRVARSRHAVAVRATSGRVWLGQDGGLRAYDGSFRVARRASALAAINRVGIDGYVSSVLPREMPALWPRQALRAQAVAARTYALRVRRVARGNGSDYDICATTACQVYGGVAVRDGPRSRITWLRHPRSNDATRATSRRVLVWRGEPILAQYASSTGGWTESGGVRYLRPVRDRWDRISPFHSWRIRVGATDIERAWPSIGALRSVRVVRRNGLGAWGGRARRVAVSGSSRTVRVSGDAFASALGLRSDWFRVARAVRAAPGVFARDLGYGMRDPDVRRLQLRLRRERVYPRSAPVTGYFGPITRASVRRFQRSHDIVDTGFVGPITRSRLNGRRYRFTTDLGYGARDPAVRELQHRLRRAGFYPRGAPHSQTFGDITRRAVRAYQRAHGLPATGYLGPRTRRSLNRG